MSELLKKLKAQHPPIPRTDPINPPENTQTVAVQVAETNGKASSVTKKKEVPFSNIVPVEQHEEGFTLYINCVPSNEYLDALVLLNKAADRAAEKAEKAHYKFAEYGTALGYLQESLQEILDEEPLQGDVYIGLYGSLARDAVDVLAKRATKIVRAVV